MPAIIQLVILDTPPSFHIFVKSSVSRIVFIGSPLLPQMVQIHKTNPSDPRYDITLTMTHYWPIAGHLLG